MIRVGTQGQLVYVPALAWTPLAGTIPASAGANSTLRYFGSDYSGRLLMLIDDAVESNGVYSTTARCVIVSPSGGVLQSSALREYSALGRGGGGLGVISNFCVLGQNFVSLQANSIPAGGGGAACVSTYDITSSVAQLVGRTPALGGYESMLDGQSALAYSSSLSAVYDLRTGLQVSSDIQNLQSLTGPGYPTALAYPFNSSTTQSGSRVLLGTVAGVGEFIDASRIGISEFGLYRKYGATIKIADGAFASSDSWKPCSGSSPSGIYPFTSPLPLMTGTIAEFVGIFLPPFGASTLCAFNQNFGGVAFPAKAGNTAHVLAANGTLYACDTSSVGGVFQIYEASLPPGLVTQLSALSLNFALKTTLSQGVNYTLPLSRFVPGYTGPIQKR